MKTIKCFICGKEIENIADGDEIHPCGGTAFRTYGHYGSGVFDPMDGSFLEIVICDSCLEKRINRPDDGIYEGVNENYRKRLKEQREEIIEQIKNMNLRDLDK